MEQQYNLNFHSAYVNKEHIYAANHHFNVFFRIKRKQCNQIELLECFNGFHHEKAWKIHSIYQYDDSLFLFSMFACEVAEYNMKTGVFSYYKPNKNCQVIDNVRSACKIDNAVWLMGTALESSYCVFSMENRSYQFFTLDILTLKKLMQDKSVSFPSVEDVCLVEKKIWRCMPGANIIYNIDTETKKVTVFELPLMIECVSLYYTGKEFCLLSLFGDTIVRWNEDAGIIDIITVDYEKKIPNAFRTCIYVEGFYLLIPAYYEHIMLLSEKEKTLMVCEVPTEFHRIEGLKASLFVNYYKNEKSILLFPFSGSGLIEIDLKTFKSTYHSIYISQIDYFKVQIGNNKLYLEKTKNDLNLYLSLISENELKRLYQDPQTQNVGMSILQELKEN